MVGGSTGKMLSLYMGDPCQNCGPSRLIGGAACVQLCCARDIQCVERGMAFSYCISDSVTYLAPKIIILVDKLAKNSAIREDKRQVSKRDDICGDIICKKWYYPRERVIQYFAIYPIMVGIKSEAPRVHKHTHI